MIESSMKDTAIAKSAGRQEGTTSIIEMVRFCLSQPMPVLTKSDPLHVNRTRRNAEARESLDNETCA